MGYYANDAMTPAPIRVSLDQHKNEITSDEPMHDEATPGMSVGVNYGAAHYNDDAKPSGSGGMGPGVSRETTSVDNSKSPLKRPENG